MQCRHFFIVKKYERPENENSFSCHDVLSIGQLIFCLSILGTMRRHSILFIIYWFVFIIFFATSSSFYCHLSRYCFIINFHFIFSSFWKVYIRRELFLVKLKHRLIFFQNEHSFWVWMNLLYLKIGIKIMYNFKICAKSPHKLILMEKSSVFSTKDGFIILNTSIQQLMQNKIF